MPNLESVLIDELAVPESLIEEAVREAYSHVRLIKIPKRNGGVRVAYQPSSKIKLIQYWLLDNCFSKIPIHISSAAFCPGASIKKNAEQHAANRYFIRVDIQDFFPSIRFVDFLPYLKEWHDVEQPTWPLDGSSIPIIQAACFTQSGTLPIGYPTSPNIANIVMRNLDELIVSELTVKTGVKDIKYTRYADDMVISCNEKGGCNKILVALTKIIHQSSSPQLKINHDKTRFMSKGGGSAIVTGIVIRQDGTITVPRKYKDQIRLILSRIRKGAENFESKEQIRGHLNHLRDIDPDYYNWLTIHYFDTIEKIVV